MIPCKETPPLYRKESDDSTHDSLYPKAQLHVDLRKRMYCIRQTRNSRGIGMLGSVSTG